MSSTSAAPTPAFSPYRLMLAFMGMLLAVQLTACGGGAGTVGLATGTALFTNAPAAVTLAAGATAGFTVGGGTPLYSVNTSNRDVASATVSGTSLAIAASRAGSATINVTDAVGASVSITVTVGSGAAVSPMFTTAPDDVGLVVNTTTTYMVGGGAGSYSATSANASIASVALSGTSLAVTAVATGSTSVRVSDAAGASVTIDVTVSQVATPVIDLLPGSATGNVGDVLQFIVRGGVPEYTITINNTSIATVAPASVTASGGAFSVRLLNVGSTLATIVDARGQSSTLPITVGALSTVLRVSPSALLVGENSSEVIDLNIFGGTGPYRVLTSDLRLSSVTVNGSTMSVAVGQNGNRCIASTSETGTYVPSGTYDVTLTAIDSLGASATSIMTIKDNGLGLNQACP